MLLKRFLIPAWCTLAALTILSAGTGNSATARYFRSDAGIAAATPRHLPDDFDSAGALRWRVVIDAGHSTPVLCGDKLILTTYRAAEQELATVALDAQSGEVLWKRAAPAARIEAFHQGMGSPAASTPAFDGQRVYVFFGSRGLICHDLDGHTLWEHPMGPFRDEYGASSSPVLLDGKLILQEDHDLDSFLTALDAKTGKVLWKTARPDAVRSYSTPSVWTHEGKTQLLVAGALELAGYDPASGEKLWWLNGLARIVIPVPVPVGDRVYMASWAPGGDDGKRLSLDPWPSALAKWDKNNDGKLSRSEIEDREVLDRFYRMDLDQSGSLDQSEWERHAAFFQRAQNAVLALKPSGRGELSASDVLWKYQRGIPYVSTPLVDQGILWMVKDGGIVTKLDAASGQVLQEERATGLGGYYASPVAGDGKVFFASEQGVVSVIASTREWRLISSHNFKEKIYATPVIDADRIYFRTEKALYCFQGN